MPEWKQEVRKRLAPLKLAPAHEAEVVEELAQHMEDRYRVLIAAGSSEQQARSAVLAELADLKELDLPQTAEPLAIGRSTRANFIADLWHDLGYGLRVLRKNSGFTAFAVLTLALGIGANSAIFSVVNTVLLRPLPYPDQDRLVTFWLTAPDKGLPVLNLTEGHSAYYRDNNRTFEELAVHTTAGFNLTGSGNPERLTGANVSARFFRVFGQEPLHGRTFLPQEDTPGNNLVTVLSYSLWQRRFGGDPQIVGKAIRLSNRPTVVVGIMPPAFDQPDRAELWVPVGLDPQEISPWYLAGVGKLKPGVDPKTAELDIATMTDDFWRQRKPSSKETAKAVVTPLKQQMVAPVGRPLLVLLAAGGLVLLIACANIGNLLLARATTRSRELALRCCLGASGTRIARQLLAEGFLLAAMGAGGGILFAWWGVTALAGLSPDEIPRIDQVRLDPAVLLFTMGMTLLTGLIFGLAPALWGARVNLQSAVKDGARGTASTPVRRWNSGFVIVQFALSLVLLVGAALLLESFRRLLARDPGFRPENVLAARLALPFDKYGDRARVRNFYGSLLENVRALPGVRAAGISQRVPLSRFNPQDEFIVEGREPAPEETIPVANIRDVSPGYFEAMGIPLRKGRRFLDSDGDTAPPVAIVDESLARKYWPGEDPIGKRIRRGNLSSRNPWMAVVGLAAEVKHASLDENATFHIYLPFSQSPNWLAYLVVRTANQPEAIMNALNKQVWSLDPELPLFEVRTMEEAVAKSVGTRRLTNILLTAFAAAALLARGGGDLRCHVAGCECTHQ